MTDQKFTRHIISGIAGAVLITVGILLAIFYTAPQDVMPALPFVLGGMGIVSLVSGISGALSVRMMRKDPSFAKEISDFYDERAILIENKAKAKTDNFTAISLWIVIIFLAVMQVQISIILVFVGVMIMRMLVMLYLTKTYSKQM